MGTINRSTMKLITTIISLATLVSAQVRDDCAWYNGNYGNSVTCPAGYIATGACSSGRRAGCSAGLSPIGNKVFTMIKCCHSKYDNDATPHDCDVDHAGSNEKTVCGRLDDGGKQKFMNSLCTSGRQADCKDPVDGKKYYETLNCCLSEDIQVETDTTKCSWLYAEYGEKQECPQGQMIVGYCGCADDGSSYGTGVFCCPYTDKRT